MDLHNLPSYFRLVQLIVPGVSTAGGNTGTEFTFPDQPDMRYARLQGMVFLTDADCAVAWPSSVPVASAANIAKICFEFMTNDPDDMQKKGQPDKDIKSQGEAGRFSSTQETIEWIPASLLHINQSNTLAGQPSFVRQMIHWKDRYIVWQKSNVKFAPGGLGNTTDVAIVLGVFYTFTTAHGRIIAPRN